MIKIQIILYHIICEATEFAFLVPIFCNESEDRRHKTEKVTCTMPRARAESNQTSTVPQRRVWIPSTLKAGLRRHVGHPQASPHGLQILRRCLMSEIVIFQETSADLLFSCISKIGKNY